MSLYEEEIDLRPYVMALTRRWWQILLAAAVAALVVFFLSSQKPLAYQATATLLLNRSRAELALAEQFRTIQEPLDLSSRIQTARTILTSDGFAQEVLENAGEELSPGYRSVGRLKGSVSIESQGDLLLVRATANDPQTAAAIANNYATLGAQAINRAYSEGQSVDEIQEQRESAQKKYEASQQALQEFMQSNQIALLETQVAEVENLVESLAKDVNTRIRYYSQRRTAMEELALEAQALRDQIAAGGASTAARLGDALAVLRLRAQAFDISVDGEVLRGEEITVHPPAQVEPFNFDLQLTEVESLADPQNITRDLDRFIELAQQEAEAAGARLEESQASLLENSSAAVLEGPTVKLQELRARLEEQQARERELKSQRDMNWQAYQVIAQKETEIRSGPQTQQYVNFASPALVPASPAPNNAIRNAVIAGFLAAMLVSTLILIATWWGMVRSPAQPISQQKGSQAAD